MSRAVPLSLEIACRAAHLDAARPESLVRYALISSGLPEPTVQVPVLDRWGG